MLFSEGNPGTGKTTIANIMSKVLQALGIANEKYAEVDQPRFTFVAPFVSKSALQTKEFMSRYAGGTVFIDEAYQLVMSGDAFGVEALNTLMQIMWNELGDMDWKTPSMIFAGYPAQMEVLMSTNIGLSRRFTKSIYIPDKTVTEIAQIFLSKTLMNFLVQGCEVFVTISDETARKKKIIEYVNGAEALQRIIPQIEGYLTSHLNQEFLSQWNGGVVDAIMMFMFQIQATRLAAYYYQNVKAVQNQDLQTFTLADIERAIRRVNEDSDFSNMESAISSRWLKARDYGLTFDLELELRDVIGLDNIKNELRQIYLLEQVNRLRKARDLPRTKFYAPHMIFMGNPGTGKTQTGKLIGKMLKGLGIISKGTFEVRTYSDLVQSKIGQTAPHVDTVITENKGGVILIDEAYMLTRRPKGSDKPSHGLEAYEVIMNRLNTMDPVFIFAGYKKEMAQFIQANPGLHRRVPRKFFLPNYTPQQIAEITIIKAEKQKFKLGPGVDAAYLKDLIERNINPFILSQWNGGMAEKILSAALGFADTELFARKECGAELTKAELETINQNHIKTAILSIGYDSKPCKEKAKSVLTPKDGKEVCKWINDIYLTEEDVYSRIRPFMCSKLREECGDLCSAVAGSIQETGLKDAIGLVYNIAQSKYCPKNMEEEDDSLFLFAEEDYSGMTSSSELTRTSSGSDYSMHGGYMSEDSLDGHDDDMRSGGGRASDAIAQALVSP